MLQLSLEASEESPEALAHTVALQGLVVRWITEPEDIIPCNWPQDMVFP